MVRAYVIKLMLVFTSLIIAAPLLAAPQLVKDISKPILVSKKNPEFSLQLPANPTTGYLWLLKGNYNANLIEPVKQIYRVNNNKLIGSPGFDTWTFRVKPLALIVPTILQLNLIYTRSWEKHAAKTIKLKIISS